METETFSLFFALLAFLAAGGAVLIAGGALLAALVPSARPALDRLRRDLGRVAVPLAWLVAATAMVGSLYYSEVADFEPCRYCWFQRIAMYPLVAVLGVAALRRDREVWWYGLPLSVIGLAISVYHYQLQRFPSQSHGACGSGPPCTGRYVDQFGFVTIPFMAGCGFAAITALLLVARRPRGERDLAGTEELP